MQILIEGEPLSIAHDHDAHFSYIVTFSDPPSLKREECLSWVIALVRAASGQGDILLDLTQHPRKSGWQPVIENVKQINQSSWEVSIVYPYTD